MYSEDYRREIIFQLAKLIFSHRKKSHSETFFGEGRGSVGMFSHLPRYFFNLAKIVFSHISLRAKQFLLVKNTDPTACSVVGAEQATEVRWHNAHKHEAEGLAESAYCVLSWDRLSHSSERHNRQSASVVLFPRVLRKFAMSEEIPSKSVSVRQAPRGHKALKHLARQRREAAEGGSLSFSRLTESHRSGSLWRLLLREEFCNRSRPSKIRNFSSSMRTALRSEARNVIIFFTERADERMHIWFFYHGWKKHFAQKCVWKTQIIPLIIILLLCLSKLTTEGGRLKVHNVM